MVHFSVLVDGSGILAHLCVCHLMVSGNPSILQIQLHLGHVVDMT